MSAFALKFIAALSMLTDHAGAVLLYTNHTGASLYWVMRSFGRVAFPIYAMLLTEGFEHTKSREKYLIRLATFAVISQLPFSLALTKANYGIAEAISQISFKSSKVYISAMVVSLIMFFIFFRGREYRKLAAVIAAAYLLSGFTVTINGYTVWSGKLNVMYTLAASLAVLWIIELWREKRSERSRLIAASVICALLCCAILLRSDYGLYGLVLVVLLCLCRNNRALLCLSMAAWCVCKYFPQSAGLTYLLIGALCAVIPAALYSGAQGRKTKLFYLVYPVHLLIYALVGLAAL